jgi:UDP-3-O-[3-hydroxymyristoyl] glucosamine N-acyltransferase
MKLSEIASRLECALEGDGDVDIRRVAGIDRAEPGDLTFLSHEKYVKKFPTTRASAVIVGRDVPARTSAALLRTDQPYLAFCKAVELLMPPAPPPTGIDPQTAIAPDVKLGPGVAIGPFVTIGAGASIGARTLIYPNVTIGPGTTIGDDCIVHSQVSIRDRVVIGHRVILQDGAVVGSEGFGFAKQPDGTHRKIQQRADIVIEDDVEIGANTTIDRPAIGETRIGEGTKIDNLVQIAHNVIIGRHCVIVAQSGVAGSAELGDFVVMGAHSGVIGHVKVGNGAQIAGMAHVKNDVEPGARMGGTPAVPFREWAREVAAIKALGKRGARRPDTEPETE